MKSTVPVGTAARVREIVRRETTHPFSVVSNPEFLKQGAAVDDFMKPDRVVIGAEDPRAKELMTDLYSPFTRTGAPIMVMDCPSAELSKYAANAILATRISFMNEMARICELFGADVARSARHRFDLASVPRSSSPASATGLLKDVKAVLRFRPARGRDPQGGRGGQRGPEGASWR
jgi:UDPglucose 6-dehydrogenase